MKSIPKCHLIPCACNCNQLLLDKDDHYRKRDYIQGHNQTYDKNNNWNGGKIITSKGYVIKLFKKHHRANNKGYVLEHILVYEQYYKCCVLKWGVIHHINKIKTDNRIENLEGMIESKHLSLHHRGMKHTEKSKRNMGYWKNKKHSDIQKQNISLGIKKWWINRKLTYSFP